MANQISLLDEITSALTLAGDTGLLKDGIFDKSKVDKVDKKQLKKYSAFLVEIRWAYDKLKKYPLYFLEFYPAGEQIDKKDALEHHIHAYLEDITLFKNRLTTFLGALKNDLKKVAINNKEIEGALVAFTEMVLDSFKNVDEYRHPHSHQGNRFLDSDIVHARLAETLLVNDSPLKDSFKPEFLEELEKQKNESFDKAKNNWIERAENNDKQMEGLLNTVLERNKGLLYQLLDIGDFAEALEVLREKKVSHLFHDKIKTKSQNLLN